MRGIRVKRETKYFLVITVIVISVLLGLKQSNILDIFSKNVDNMEALEAIKLFDNAQNVKKIKLKYRDESFEGICSVMDEILGYNNTILKYSNTKKTYKTYVFEVPDTAYTTIFNKLKKVDDIETEILRLSLENGFSQNFAENAKNLTFAKTRIKELMKNTSSSERLAQFNKQLNETQKQLDELEKKKLEEIHKKDYNILLLTAISNVEGDGLNSSMRSFIKTTVTSLIFLIALLFVVYYFVMIIIKLMELAGIKSQRSSGSYGKYRYSKAGYGRSSSRVYKDGDDETKE